MTTDAHTTLTPQSASPADFRKFWLGQTISNLGDSFTSFALPLLVYQITGSALNLAIAGAVAFAPYLLFGLVIGAWVDRVDRRRLMIASDIARALLIASVPLLTMAGFFALWYVYMVEFVAATLAIGFNAAQSAAVPSLVERDALADANARLIAGWSAASIAGPLLAGGLAAIVPLPALLIVDALSFLASALALAMIRRGFNPGERGPATSVRQNIVEGLRYVWNTPVLRAVTLLLMLLNIVGPTTRVQLVLFAKQRLAASDAQVGLLSAAASAGVLLGSLAARQLTRRWPLGRAALGAVMLQALLLIAFAQARQFWAALPIWGLVAGVGVVVDISVMSLRQAATPNQLLGRVTTVSRTIGFVAIPLSTLLGGVLIDRFGNVVLIYSAIGALTFVIGVAFWLSRLGRAERSLPPISSGNG